MSNTRKKISSLLPEPLVNKYKTAKNKISSGEYKEARRLINDIITECTQRKIPIPSKIQVLHAVYEMKSQKKTLPKDDILLYKEIGRLKTDLLTDQITQEEYDMDLTNACCVFSKHFLLLHARCETTSPDDEKNAYLKSAEEWLNKIPMDCREKRDGFIMSWVRLYCAKQDWLEADKYLKKLSEKLLNRKITGKNSSNRSRPPLPQ